MNLSNKLITILGPTAVGKTKFATQLAYKFDGEIISADSRQVYIGMNIGTGKDLEDYTINNQQIPYHLIDVVKPHYEFNLYLFQQLFLNSYKEITSRNKKAFLVGGTSLYLNSILQNYALAKVDFNSKRAEDLSEYSESELKNILLNLEQTQHNTTDLIDKKRLIKAILITESMDNNKEDLELEPLVIGVTEDRQIVKERIRDRLKVRLANGMIDEVKTLLENGIAHNKLRFFGLEYKFISMYLTGELNHNDMQQKLASAII
ncbi:MAG: tRNA (adenosine(37)-N6)-dimethylallyltransferase MiaA, partial [Ignavibacteriae bacterium]|nr:tRNA (adenosine(37)-N6)-dimethylallyltransferase MiaA [Ignavibacteriota bacterium]